MADTIASKLVATMRRSLRPGVVKLRDFVQGRQAARKQLAEVKSIKSLVAAGHDPLHAAYLHGQNYLSVFGELASRLSEFETYRAVVARAEETYVPGWPPMSPVSVSFFTSWALLDLLFGEANDTICSCALEVGRVFGISDDLALTLEVLGESTMGIYEHLGGHDGVVGLRNIVDGQTYPCIVPSNYAGRPGELWYVRLLPPLNASFNCGVAFTSPYVLLDTTKADWLAFLDRQGRMLFQVGATDDLIIRRKAMLKQVLNATIGTSMFFLPTTTHRPGPSPCAEFRTFLPVCPMPSGRRIDPLLLTT
jgi:hypothetical protein